RPAAVALALAGALVLGVNASSWLTGNLKLALPTTIGATTPATRAALRAWLQEHDLRFVYTNYWLAYPLAFESDERIVPSLIADGFNRYIPYAHWVSVA